jgi:hypothetical protein
VPSNRAEKNLGKRASRQTGNRRNIMLIPGLLPFGAVRHHAFRSGRMIIAVPA